jgi:16S rRNA (guanine966-N2)-methyltransferase
VIRIAGGRLRGRLIETDPDGEARPTALRARQAVFNRLQHGLLTLAGAPLEGIHVLDAFAGTGAMGFEALSRGAASVTFVELVPDAARRIERTIALLGESDRARVLRRSATDLATAERACALAFFDAPYRSQLTPPALGSALGQGWLAPGAIVVAEIAASEKLDIPVGIAVLDERRYGAARIVFLCVGPPADGERHEPSRE